jgi:hypothetical protein
MRRYDIGGEGACLKRYTDPSFFRTDSACSTLPHEEGIRDERRPLKAMVINTSKFSSMEYIRWLKSAL